MQLALGGAPVFFGPPDVLAQYTAIRLDAMAKLHPRPVLVVPIDRLGAAPSEELQSLASSYAQGAATLVEENPFWREIPQSYLCGAPRLFTATADWLFSNVSGDQSSVA